MDSTFWVYVGLAVLANIAILSPVFVSAYLAVRRGRGVQGRWVFVLAGPVVAYTVAILLSVIFVLPVWIAAVFFVPAIVQVLGIRPYWISAYNLHSQYWFFYVSVLLSAMSTWLSWYLWPRWPAVFLALTSSAATPHPRNGSSVDKRG